MPTTTFLLSKLSKYSIIIICRVKREFKEGDSAPLAHSTVRDFPAWYKPYTFNYESDGYMLLAFGTIALFGYSYLSFATTIE